MILDRFKELVNDYYTEPTDEEILGFFLTTISHDSPFGTQEIILQYEHNKLHNIELLKNQLPFFLENFPCLRPVDWYNSLSKLRL